MIELNPELQVIIVPGPGWTLATEGYSGSTVAIWPDQKLIQAPKGWTIEERD